ncbi:MAG: hypothetical protein AB7Q97_24855 [Gammaproteobacteria bacterium]
MPSFRSFVVRVYRQQGHDIAGEVVDVRTGSSKFFCSFSDLRTALTLRPGRPARPGRTRPGHRPGA